MQTLYFLRDLDSDIRGSFRSKAYEDHRGERYANLATRVNLKSDLHWHEVKDLLAIVRGADMWDDFPIPDHTLIAADQKFGSEDQRLDLLYLNNSGELIAGELKIGGEETDTHGQLIRYIADLNNEEITWDWIEAQRNRYLGRLPEITSDILTKKFERFRAQLPADTVPRLNSTAGFILDEDFKSPLVTSIEFLRSTAQIDFTFVRISAYGDPSVTADDREYYLRLEIEPRT